MHVCVIIHQSLQGAEVGEGLWALETLMLRINYSKKMERESMVIYIVMEE